MQRPKLTAAQKARSKYNAAQRAMGKPNMVPTDRVRAHVRWLHDEMGMTLQWIADVSQTSLGCVHNQHVHATKTITRRNQDKILAVTPDSWPHRGSLVDATGTRRRLGALAVAGYPIRWLPPRVGVTHTNLLLCAQGHKKFVFISNAQSVAEAYKELITRKPIEYGIAANPSKVAQHYARLRNYAPATAWDDDGIDNPDVFAEWTGACGTESGYRIHAREGHLFYHRYVADPTHSNRVEDRKSYTVTACDPCRKAHSEYGKGPH